MPARSNNTELTAGIRALSDPRDWLVRPWPIHASFCEIAQHFQFADFRRRWSENTEADNRAFYETYEKALHAASTHELTSAWAKRWHSEMLDCVRRCVVQSGGTSIWRSEDDPQTGEDQHIKAVKQQTGKP